MAINRGKRKKLSAASEWSPARRRYELHRRLLKKRPVVASQIAREFGVSEKTIRRTLSKMRDEVPLPLECDRQARTWRYTGEVAELEPMLLSGEDRRGLLFSLRAAAQIENTPVAAQVDRIYCALLDTLPPERSNRFSKAMESVYFAGPIVPPIDKTVWNVVLLCLEANETMRIGYRDSYYDHPTDRDVDPYGLVTSNRHWQLIAYCHRRGCVTPFTLSRISSAQLTDRTFTPPPDAMEQYLKDAFLGYQSDGEKHRITLKIDAKAPLYVRNRFWSENETVVEQHDGCKLITFTTAALFMVEREVRAEGPWVEVIEPAFLRQQIHNQACELANLNRPTTAS